MYRKIQNYIFDKPYIVDDYSMYKIYTINDKYLINIEDNIVGYAIIKDSIDIYELIEIGILEEYRNKNYAYILLKKILEELKKDIFLEVYEKNENAIKLYEKLNFEKISIRKNYYGNNKNAIIMKYNLI